MRRDGRCFLGIEMRAFNPMWRSRLMASGLVPETPVGMSVSGSGRRQRCIKSSRRMICAVLALLGSHMKRVELLPRVGMVLLNIGISSSKGVYLESMHVS